MVEIAYESALSEMASWSIQTLLQGSLDRHTHSHRQHYVKVATACIYAPNYYGMTKKFGSIERC